MNAKNTKIKSTPSPQSNPLKKNLTPLYLNLARNCSVPKHVLMVSLLNGKFQQRTKPSAGDNITFRIIKLLGAINDIKKRIITKEKFA